MTLPPVVGKLGCEREDTWGELDVHALLAVFGVPGLDRRRLGPLVGVRLLVPVEREEGWPA